MLWLLNIIIICSSNLVRHAAARVIAAIATIEVPQGTWNQLLPWLRETCLSREVSHREVGSFILFTVLESIVEGFQAHLPGLFELFQGLLVDPESIEVRITTVRCAVNGRCFDAIIILTLILGHLESLPNTSTQMTKPN